MAWILGASRASAVPTRNNKKPTGACGNRSSKRTASRKLNRPALWAKIGMTNFETNAVKFSEAARTASLLELWMRHLAEATTGLRALAHARHLATVEDAVVTHFKNALSKSDVAVIVHARDVRNKLLHCEFWTVKALLDATGANSNMPEVTIIDLNTGSAKPASEATAEEPRIYGWLWMGAAPGGIFEQADAAFAAAICVVKRLMSVAAAEHKI